MRRPTCGDAVRIRSHAPAEMRPGSFGSVCAFTLVDNDDRAKRYGYPIGTTMLLVEYGDGHAIEIPEDLLELDDE